MTDAELYLQKPSVLYWTLSKPKWYLSAIFNGRASMVRITREEGAKSLGPNIIMKFRI